MSTRDSLRTDYANRLVDVEGSVIERVWMVKEPPGRWAKSVERPESAVECMGSGYN